MLTLWQSLNVCLMLAAIIDSYTVVSIHRARRVKSYPADAAFGQPRIPQPQHRIPSTSLHAKGFGKDSHDDDGNKPINTGDQLRASTGIRPSLHPIVINAIADALKSRSLQALGKIQEELHFAVDEDNNVTPLDVAMTAGTFSAKYLALRQEQNPDEDEILTEKEEQAVAGRIMGVIMRLEALEEALRDAVQDTPWIADYGEWTTFGVVEQELKEEDPSIHQPLVDNPLLAMNRAECLLGLFLKEVERPQLEKVKESVPDGSKIDFLDADRMEVLGLVD